MTSDYTQTVFRAMRSIAQEVESVITDKDNKIINSAQDNI